MESGAALAPAGSTSRRWALIISAVAVQLISGAVYAMGVWQSALRDALDLDTAAITAIGAATFAGSIMAMLGGKAFDALGPRDACALGGSIFACGYLTIGLAVYFADQLSPVARVAMPAVGCALAGYSSVSLLDNVVCMACSLSFPKDRASLVGYLKAVLASAAGLWALLWVHVFKTHYGLVAYIACTAVAAVIGVGLALLGLTVLPPEDRQPFDAADSTRLSLAIGFTVSLALFSVGVSARRAHARTHTRTRTHARPLHRHRPLLALAARCHPPGLLLLLQGPHTIHRGPRLCWHRPLPPAHHPPTPPRIRHSKSRAARRLTQRAARCC